MQSDRTGLVDIVRDFLAAHLLVRRLFARYRSEELRFEELHELVGDDEGSVLYRLKERCHSLFRRGDVTAGMDVRREELFDLAVGSLFHEAMKFRESFYQREIYGPRVRALRTGAGADADPLFDDFEKILAAVSLRLAEGLQETEDLLEHTREQLRVLLVEHRENGHVTRFLLENSEVVEDVFGLEIDGLLAQIHGDAPTAYEVAGRSYLESGYYNEAEHAFAESISRGGDRAELERLAAYAHGMDAYLSGHYGTTVEWLARWVDAAPEEEASLAELAHAAVAQIGQLALGDDKQKVMADAASLLEKLSARRSAPSEA
jgi:FAD/FMN-containing dehydrogenase